jgi:hypothetical protein
LPPFFAARFADFFRLDFLLDFRVVFFLAAMVDRFPLVRWGGYAECAASPVVTRWVLA